MTLPSPPRSSGTQLPSATEIFEILDQESSRKAVKFDFLSTRPSIFDAHHQLTEAAGSDDSWTTNYESLSLEEIIEAINKNHNDLTLYIKEETVDLDLLKKFYRSLVPSEDLSHSESLFVFGAASNARIERAIELYKNGIGSKIVISGNRPVYSTSSESEAARMSKIAIESSVPTENIILEEESITVPDNVKRTLDLLETMRWQPASITIIATNFVLQRAMMDWYKFTPWDIQIKVVAAHPQSQKFTEDGWYKDDESIALVMNEYAKLVFESKVDLLRRDGKMPHAQPQIRKRLLPWLDESHKIKPTCIVLHWWNMPDREPGIESLCNVLGSRKLSVQFAILKNGEIYQLSLNENTYCRHAKCANDSSIGIEIEGNNAEDLDNNEVQYQSVLKLTDYLKHKYSIENDFHVLQDGDITRFFGISSHKQVDRFCANGTGKDDVHDEYLYRVLEDLN